MDNNIDQAPGVVFEDIEPDEPGNIAVQVYCTKDYFLGMGEIDPTFSINGCQYGLAPDNQISSVDIAPDIIPSSYDGKIHLGQIHARRAAHVMGIPVRDAEAWIKQAEQELNRKLAKKRITEFSEQVKAGFDFRPQFGKP